MSQTSLTRCEAVFVKAATLFQPLIRFLTILTTYGYEFIVVVDVTRAISFAEEKKVKSIDPMDEVMCKKCGRGDDENCLLLCDDCDYALHTYCCEPPLNAVPKGVILYSVETGFSSRSIVLKCCGMKGREDEEVIWIQVNLD